MIKRNLHMKRPQYGFTLVELAVVIGVIGILATVGMMSYVQVQRQTRDSQRQSDMTSLQSQLEKFYESNGAYPPGCPQSSCSSWFLTENTSAPILNSTSTPANLQTAFPNLTPTFSDPAAIKGTNPLIDITSTLRKYFYFGGTIDNRATSSSISYGPTALFPCTIQSSLAPSQAGSYVVGYYSEVAKSWVLTGGKHGVPMTVTSGSTSDGCVINS